MEIRSEVKDLYQHLHNQATSATSAGHENLITVSPATTHIAFAYERLRNVLEPDEEHILRHKAIHRILERRLPEAKSAHDIAFALLQELIRARYTKPLPEQHLQTITSIIHKARSVYQLLSEDAQGNFLSLIAVVIDRVLFPQPLYDQLTHLMYKDMFNHISWQDGILSQDERPKHLFIACHRVLFALDQANLLYHFFLRKFPSWENGELTTDETTHIAREFPHFFHEGRNLLAHPVQSRLIGILRPAAVPYRILGDLLQHPDPSLWTTADTVARATHQAVDRRRQRIRQRISQRTAHSIAFLLTTKTIFTLSFELTYEILFLQTIHWLALFINLIFHPLLLFILGNTARLPGKENTDQIVEHLQSIIVGPHQLPVLTVKAPHRYAASTQGLFAILFIAMFTVLFWMLNQLQFSFIAAILFTVFLGLVSYLALRIRRSVSDIQLVRRPEGTLSFLSTLITLPILEFGRWLAITVTQINVFVFFLDLIIEAPLKLLIDVIEEWFAYIRERKEELT